MTSKPALAALAAGLLLALSAVTASHGPARAAPARSAQPAWPQSTSDIKPDPDTRYGVLDNGMRYAVRRNTTPSGQASLRLRMDAGSLMETDAQQGIAHYLEHMAFNGSRHVPEGEMVKILERHGLAFGADTNAQTSWTETVYQLDLPSADADTVDTGLMLMRETASELLLEPGAVGRERGVVLSEERARDTPGLRVFKQGIGFFLKDQIASRRLPIGQASVIDKADQALIGGFYRRWYRPDRATLIAVGDFDPSVMEAKIKARFSDWRAAAPVPVDPSLGSPPSRNFESKLVVEPGSSLSMQVEWVKPADRTPDSFAKRRRKTIEQLGLAVLNRRLGRIARSASPPFIAAQASKGDNFHSAEATVLAVSADPMSWRGALAAAEQEQRRIVQFGVGQDELDREIKEVRVALQAEVAGAGTRRTPRIANEMVDAIDDKEVYTPPAEDLRMFEATVKGLTAATVDASLKSVFSGSGPLLFMATPQAVDGGQDALAKAFQESRSKPVSAGAAAAAKAWPYVSFGAPGKVAERHELSDLGASLVRFENGVRLTVKPTSFRKDQVLVRIRFGHGEIDLPTDRVTTAWAHRGALIDGGLKDLTAEEIEQILAANIYGADFSVADDAFVLQGATRPEDLQVQLQVLAAYATAPGFRPEAFQRMKTYMATLFEQMQATPSGVMGRNLPRLLHGGDPRYAFPSPEEVAASSPEEFRAEFAPALATGPVEVTIVGDTTVDRAIEVIANTFGALPPRTEPPTNPQSKRISLPPPNAAPLLLNHKGRADQALAFAEWPTTDFFADPQEARTLRVLAEIVELRLLDDLREAAGDTYSPQAAANASLVFPGYGYVQALVEIPPAKLDDFWRDLDKITADLKAKDVSADELERARKPLLEGLLKSRETNEYWLEQLSGGQAEPRKLDAVRGVLQSLQAVDAARIREAARRYLSPDKLWRLQITPEAKPAAG